MYDCTLAAVTQTYPGGITHFNPLGCSSGIKSPQQRLERYKIIVILTAQNELFSLFSTSVSISGYAIYA